MYGQRLSLEPQGYRVTSIEVVNSYTQTPKYIPVFKKNGNLSMSVEKRIFADFPSQVADFNEFEANGMTPVIIAAENYTFQALGWGAMPFYHAMWRGDARRKRKLKPDGSGIGTDLAPKPGDGPYDAPNSGLGGAKTELKISR